MTMPSLLARLTKEARGSVSFVPAAERMNIKSERQTLSHQSEGRSNVPSLIGITMAELRVRKATQVLIGRKPSALRRLGKFHLVKGLDSAATFIMPNVW